MDPLGLEGAFSFGGGGGGGAWGERLADRLDASLNGLESRALAGDEHWIWNGTVGTLGDLGRGSADMLRFGRGFAEDQVGYSSTTGKKLTDLERSEAFWGDVGRGSGIVLTAAGPFRPSKAPTVPRNGLYTLDDFPGLADALSKSRTTTSQLLPNEGAVGRYGDLIRSGSKGDNLTPHHVPGARHMSNHGVCKNDGFAMNMEQPSPGTGGRHRQTFNYGNGRDADMSSRDALAAGIRDLRRIYQRDGLYSPALRRQLQELIRLNKTTYPHLFGRGS